MFRSLTPDMLFFLALVSLCVLPLIWLSRKQTRRLPGPIGLPLLGNIHQIPHKNFHLEFQKMAKKFGPIMQLKLGVQTLVVLNDPAVVHDLLDKRGNIYSCRPDLYIRGHGNGHLNIALRDNDEIWRKQRKIYHTRLNPRDCDTYLPYQDFESMQLLKDLLEGPENWKSHIQRYTASISSALVYGWRIPEFGSGHMEDLLKWFSMTSEVVNFQLCDFFPFLRPIYDLLPYWVLKSKRKLRDIRILENRAFFELLKRAKKEAKAGQARPCLIHDMLSDISADRLSDVQIAHNAAHGFGAGMETSANTLLGFVKAVVLFSNVQEQAQREIDAVVGDSRLPNWDDRPNLPLICGIVEETLRWAPSVLSGAVPHAAKRDDCYKGMHIPKNSMVMMNVWALNHEHFAQPREFMPWRHSIVSSLHAGGKPAQGTHERPHFTFGAGRRICPGIHVAERTLFLAIARILWAFSITRAKNAYGDFLPIDRDAVSPGMIVRPEDFQCVFTPRSKNKEQVMVAAWQTASRNAEYS